MKYLSYSNETSEVNGNYLPEKVFDTDTQLALVDECLLRFEETLLAGTISFDSCEDLDILIRLKAMLTEKREREQAARLS